MCLAFIAYRLIPVFSYCIIFLGKRSLYDHGRMQAQQPMKVKAYKMNTQSEADSAAAALRAELELELQNKKQCSYQPYECTQLTLDGFKYCSKHILQDKNAPFKQCSYVYSSNGKRCHLPAPRGDKKDYGYCHEHALKTTLVKNKQNSKYPPPNTAEVLLHSLAHYVKKPRNRVVYPPNTHYSEEAGGTSPEDSGESKITKVLDPFVDLDANSIYSRQCNDVLDLCSESESDVEASTFSSVWHDAQAESSDNESIDSDQEDVLKHANIYTAEEITLVTRDKLIRLQSLYIEQFRHLQHILREKRRKYLHALKREKETCCNIYSQVRDNPKEQRLYKKLKAYNNYHKTYGVDAILNKRLKDLRAKYIDGIAPKVQNYSKCLFTEGGVKCGERTLPLARHCRKHILEDTNQVLFRACGKMNGDVECNTPIEAIFDDSLCRLHMEIPPLRSYNQPRKDSESDPDDSTEVPSQFPLDFNDSVKTEMIDYNLSQEIPKMETVPSLLFEETQSTLIDSQNQQEIFEGSSSVDVMEDMNVESNELTCGYSQEQISCESENKSFSVESEIKPNVEDGETSNIPMEETDCSNLTDINIQHPGQGKEIAEVQKEGEIEPSGDVPMEEKKVDVEEAKMEEKVDVEEPNVVDEVMTETKALDSDTGNLDQQK